MRLILLIVFTMLAFASNSILTRLAIEPGYIDPFSFALIRVLAGAVFLVALVVCRGNRLPLRGPTRAVGAISLAVYMVGFSLAYVTLDAGLGALILFGIVQMSMFAYSTVIGIRPTLRQILGAGIAFAGLTVALWPDEEASASLQGVLSMMLAGVGWAAYTLSGKEARTPISETAANFAMCLPILALATGFLVDRITLQGVLLAILCGAVTSGLGYALWYTVLPRLQRSVAAVVQLSVPILAILAGAVLLSEPLSVKIGLAAVLVLLGIAMAVTRQSIPKDRR